MTAPTPPQPPSSQLSSIQHIVQLMLENRSFDHMLGFLYPNKTGPGGQPFEGLLGTESNNDASGNPVPVFQIQSASAGAYYMPGADPGEGYVNTNVQLFGTSAAPSPPVATNSGFLTNFATAITYDQRTGQGIESATTANNIMGVFTPQALPVLSGLARGFAVCDHWYASVPTETIPNRAFAHAATSQGHMNDSTTSFTVQSIFGLLTAHNVSWKIYGYTDEPMTRGNFPDLLSAPDTNFGHFTDFQADAAAGNLAAYTFLEPGWGSDGNSQHANYDVALGEVLIQQVYETLRSGPGWNQTLLIISYDEHGGCYDHVPPPSGATPPDATPGEFGFDFTRFGVRVPAVLVSPLIEAGTIYRVPAGSMPIDHTSVLKTIESRWGLPPLSARDRAAPDLGAVLTLTTPRADDPLAGVTAPASASPAPAAGQVSNLLRVQAQMASSLPIPPDHLGAVPAQPDFAHLTTPTDFSNFISARTSAWRTARQQGQVPGAHPVHAAIPSPSPSPEATATEASGAPVPAE
jgi:phospholipase C